jgi:hypothetical protein
MVNGIKDANLITIYRFVCEFEKNIKQMPGHYDINNRDIDRFIRKIDLYIGTISKEHKRKAIEHSFYLLFDQYKRSKISKDDVAHHLMRHIRNSFSHGNMSQKNDIVSISDYNEKCNTMDGRIPIKSLLELIDLLKNSYHE